MWSVTEYCDSDEARLKLYDVLACWREMDFHFWSSAEIINACQIPATTLMLLGQRGKEYQGIALARRVERTVELFYIYIAPAYRKKELSRVLLDRLFDHFKNEADEMFLEVRAANTAAQKAYIRYGFTRMSLRKGYYSDGEDAIVMHKPLKGATQ